MTINGYGCTATWDGQTLRAKGTNKVAHFALMGQNEVDIDSHIEGAKNGTEAAKGLKSAWDEANNIPAELVLPREAFEVEKFRPGTMLTNGRLVLRTTAGRTHELHFRKKHNSDFEALHAALTSA